MAKKSVTIRDVARHAGVSVATASRALNGKDVVNPQTRDRILVGDGGARLLAEPGGATAEPRADAHGRRRRLVPHPAAGGGAAPRRRRRPDRQRVRPRHLQRRVGPEARPLPRHARPVAAHRRPDRDVAAAARRGGRRCWDAARSRSSSSTSTRRRSRRCPASSATTSPAARWRRATCSTSATRRSASSAMPSQDPFGFTSSRDREQGLTRRAGARRHLDPRPTGSVTAPTAGTRPGTSPARC